jgi:hypothetical protein
MNFFGHASVAIWRTPPSADAQAAWVLGAMLPDFASMSRARIEEAEDEVVRAGIAFHHRTDEAFHGAPTFVDLYENGAIELEALGLSRGQARAVAHVGTELVLDGLLLEEGSAASAYLEAVALAPRTPLRFSQGADRFASLAARLASFGLPDDYRTAAGAALRLEQCLLRRPRLAFGAAERDRVLLFLERTRGTLASRLDLLLGEIEAGLGGSGLVDTARTARAILPG